MVVTSASDPANQAHKLSASKQPRDAKGHFVKNAGTGVPQSTLPKLPSLISINTSATPSTNPVFSATDNTKPATNPPNTPAKKTVPPLLELKITNPIVYIKAWWKKVVASEGVDLRFRIHPLTAITIVAVIATFGFGVGRFTIPAGSPIIKYIPSLAPPPIPDPWKETAFTGTLKYTEANKRYYLVTTDSEAITLEVPTNVNMTKLISKRILAVGRYNTQTGILVVTDASDLEILPAQAVPVPILPQASPSGTPSPATQ